MSRLADRRISFEFPDDMPVHYYPGSAFCTHLLNGLHLMNPPGERFFIRTLRHYLPTLSDCPPLLREVKMFMAQEVRHGNAHEGYLRVLERHGYEIRTFLKWYDVIAFKVIERCMPPRLRLSVTAALEHFTAVLGERALVTDFLDEVHPVMRRLFQWHGAEEIEHKAVAFDVLKRVDDGYLLRMLGLFLGVQFLSVAWVGGALMLMAQEQGARAPTKVMDIWHGFRRGVIGEGELWRGFVQYLRPSFHPNDNDNLRLCADFFAQSVPTAS